MHGGVPAAGMEDEVALDLPHRAADTVAELVHACDGHGADALAALGAGDGVSCQHLDVALARGGDRSVAGIAAKIDDGGNRGSGLRQVAGRPIGAVIVGHHHDAAARQRAIAVGVGPRRARQHDARAVIVGEHQRPLDGACCENHLFRANLPQALPIGGHDHVVRIADLINNLEQLSHIALEAKFALISVAQNDDTKRLAAWAAIIAVPTMIAGLYGMNFDFMPETKWVYGYPVVILVMLTICGLLYGWFRKVKWL